MPRPDVPDAAMARRMLALLREDEVDAAIEAGLARFEPLDALDAADNATLAGARDRLLSAWAARDRHRARADRLRRIAEERARTARPPAPAGSTAGAGADADTDAVVAAEAAEAADPAGMRPAPCRPALPAAAAAALARARARTSGKSP